MKLIVRLVSFCLILSTVMAFDSRKKNEPKRSVISSFPDPVIGLNLGNQAPEIALNSVNGAMLPLSSLRGKLVLIDFWASWCGPCRMENPYVVKAFQEYKEKKFKNGDGFTVYSVSLDMDANAWKKGIEKDGLVWENHVSDLQGWNSSAALKYNITGIPFNLLLNDQGIIIQKNLRGEDLNAALEKLLQK